MVDGVFARAVPLQIKPIELGRRLIREMDDHRTVDVRGRTVVPNDFTFYLIDQDLPGFADVHDALVRELADAAREYARRRGLRASWARWPSSWWSDERAQAGPLHRDQPDAGAPRRRARTRPARGRAPACCGDQVFRFGRLPENDLVIADPNVSRRHAEIRPVGPDFVIVDLGSTNGTKVNGATVSRAHAAGRATPSASAPPRSGSRRTSRRGGTTASCPNSSSASSSCASSALLYLFFAPRPVGRVERGAGGPPAGERRRNRSTARRPRRRPRRRRSPPVGRGGGRPAPPHRRPSPPPGGATASSSSGTELTIGRATGCHVVAAGRHVRLQRPRPRVRRSGDAVYVEDLGSTNGTFLNGHAGRGTSAAAARRPAPGRQHRHGRVVTADRQDRSVR